MRLGAFCFSDIVVPASRLSSVVMSVLMRLGAFCFSDSLKQIWDAATLAKVLMRLGAFCFSDTITE